MDSEYFKLTVQPPVLNSCSCHVATVNGAKVRGRHLRMRIIIYDKNLTGESVQQQINWSGLKPEITVKLPYSGPESREGSLRCGPDATQ